MTCPEVLAEDGVRARCTRRVDHTDPEMHAVTAGGRVLLSWHRRVYPPPVPPRVIEEEIA
jgi:hypothetical protein